ncbi:protein ADM2 [Suncus etruscus]|uniref:protein ADM2 n=1 Tax=Suncus etruscus TaxID=109475 RepID=UPI002110D5B1|nr:protein ADM2 [Suncus etruscus]
MARLPVALACISLLCLQLPGALARARTRAPAKGRPRAQTPLGDPHPQRPAPRPAVWKRWKVHPQRSASLAPRSGHRAWSGPHRRRHRGSSGPYRTRAQLLRVGCVLGTCQVQNLSHRLWQLLGPPGPRDVAPVDPSSPYSYG